MEDEDGRDFAVCYSEALDDYVVTDATGELLEDGDLAQEIFEDFRAQAEEAANEETPPE